MFYLTHFYKLQNHFTIKNLFFILALFLGVTSVSVAYSAGNYDIAAATQEKPQANDSRKVTLSSGGLSLEFEVDCSINCASINAAVATVSLATGVPISVDCVDCDGSSSTPANGPIIHTLAELKAAAEKFAHNVLAGGYR